FRGISAGRVTPALVRFTRGRTSPEEVPPCVAGRQWILSTIARIDRPVGGNLRRFPHRHLPGARPTLPGSPTGGIGFRPLAEAIGERDGAAHRRLAYRVGHVPSSAGPSRR